MIRRLIAQLAIAVVTLPAGQSLAQSAFPAPLPGQTGAANASPFPPVSEAAEFTSSLFGVPLTQAGSDEDCTKGYQQLRDEAERRGKLIKAASERHAAAGEACKLIGNFGQAETKMIKYVETHAAKCGIPPQISDQLKRGHQGTETLQQKVCAAARQTGPSGPTGDFWILERQL